MRQLQLLNISTCKIIKKLRISSALRVICKIFADVFSKERERNKHEEKSEFVAKVFTLADANFRPPVNQIFRALPPLTMETLTIIRISKSTVESLKSDVPRHEPNCPSCRGVRLVEVFHNSQMIAQAMPQILLYFCQTKQCSCVRKIECDFDVNH